MVQDPARDLEIFTTIAISWGADRNFPSALSLLELEEITNLLEIPELPLSDAFALGGSSKCCTPRARSGCCDVTWAVLMWNAASLTSSVQAGFVSQHSQHRRDAGYSDVGCGLRPSYESFQKTGKRTGTGTDIKPGEFPWLVSIQSHGKHICGGTIISALWILTAAHCFVNELPPDLTVAVGGVDLNLPLEEHNPDSLILHEEFNRTSLQNDIALILLSNPIEFSKEKIPACLPFVCDMDTWQLCWAAGWENTSAASHVLQKTQMKLISKEKCLEQTPHLVESVMCAETERGGGGGGGGRGCQILFLQIEAVWESSVALCAWWGAEHLWIQLETKSQLALGVGNGCDDSEKLPLIQ
ncbi:hypothetical protein Nmel_004969 [Mimus melanotis]